MGKKNLIDTRSGWEEWVVNWGISKTSRCKTIHQPLRPHTCIHSCRSNTSAAWKYNRRVCGGALVGEHGSCGTSESFSITARGTLTNTKHMRRPKALVTSCTPIHTTQQRETWSTPPRSRTPSNQQHHEQNSTNPVLKSRRDAVPSSATSKSHAVQQFRLGIIFPNRDNAPRQHNPTAAPLPLFGLRESHNTYTM